MPDSPQNDRCDARLNGHEDVRCELPNGHNSRHEWNGGELRWEPAYVGELRRQRAELRSALRDALALLDLAPSDWSDDDREMLKWLRVVDGGLPEVPE